MIPNATQFRLRKTARIWHQSILGQCQLVLPSRPDPHAALPVLKPNCATTLVVLLHAVYGQRPALVEPIVVEERVVERAIQFALHLSIIDVGHGADGGLEQKDENHQENVLKRRRR